MIPPDLPGFGNTKAPPRGEFTYSFDSLARTIGDFTEALHLDRFALYIFDYSLPVGPRVAMSHPERLTATISQNGRVAEAIGLWGRRVERGEDLEEAVEAWLAPPWPALLDVVTDRFKLVMPAHVDPSQVFGTALYSAKAILGGRVGDVARLVGQVVLP